MEPLNDKELNQLLREWQAPAAPPTLARRMPPPRLRWWRWLWSGSIRMPVPVGITALAALALFFYFRPPRPAPALQSVVTKPGVVQPRGTVSLADFQPVKQLEPRVIGRANEGN